MHVNIGECYNRLRAYKFFFTQRRLVVTRIALIDLEKFYRIHF